MIKDIFSTKNASQEAPPQYDPLKKTNAINSSDFWSYQINIVHGWLQIVTVLVVVLMPLFFVLDVFVVPDYLVARFALYRTVSTTIALLQHLIVRKTKPSFASLVQGYIVSIQVGFFIALMTAHLGGFESRYYPGLIMVIIGVNLLMPWKALHTALNSFIIIAMYLVLGVVANSNIDPLIAANNLFFLIGTSVIAVAITHVRYSLIYSEFSLLVQLREARDALWGEMELAKEVQVALLPDACDVEGYEISVSYTPAKEVGGDYYDVIETEQGSRLLAIGDVSGHGLDSGLIMMMAQTSVMTMVQNNSSCRPTEILKTINHVLRENIGRLESQHYMTMSMVRLEDDYLTIAGHHQDILVYRRAEKQVEKVTLGGTWLGIADNIDNFLQNVDVPLSENDYVLFFSDGITEAESENGEMFGQERLIESLKRNAGYDLQSALEHIIAEVREFQYDQDDDMTLIMLKRK